MTIEEKKPEIKSFRVQFESLDGGFVSDVSGKRKIHNSSNSIIKHLELEETIDKLDLNEYHLNIDIVPKDKMADYVDFVAQITSDKPEDTGELTYEEAKAQGIIKAADKFDPNPTVKEEQEDLHDIKITQINAYSASKLKSINWKHYDEQLSLDHSQRVSISGMSNQAMYNQWRKALKGTASFHLSKTRIEMTILAKYYEKNLGLRSSSKDNLDKVKEEQLKELRELELVASHTKFVKNTVILSAINKMRKQLL